MSLDHARIVADGNRRRVRVLKEFSRNMLEATLLRREKHHYGCCQRKDGRHVAASRGLSDALTHRNLYARCQAVVDEPKEREGTNVGPSPTETLVAALIACTNVIGHKCAAKHGVTFKAMSIDAESMLDRRGTQLLEEIEVPFPKIRLVINVTTDASEAQMEQVKADLRRFCAVSRVIRNSGTEVEEVWIVKRS